jgi:hypothetical protein
MTTDEALDLALEALENQRIFTLRPDHEGKELTPKQVLDAITAIKQARSAPVQEPVAYLVYDKGAHSQYLAFEEELGDMDDCEVEPLYTTPPAAPVQSAEREEPVAWIFKPNRELLWPNEVERKNPLELNEYAPLYTTPSAAPVQEPDHGDELTIAYMSGLHDGKKKRAWVGLTDECRKQLINEVWSEYITGIDDGRTFGEWMSVATEAKLKELNT